MRKFDHRTVAERAYAEKQRWKVARLHACLREIAAGSRGLKHAGHAASQLGKIYDHPTTYNEVGTRRPVAIIVHPYGRFTQAQVDAIARKYGVRGKIIKPTMYPHPDAQTIVFWRKRR